MQTLHSSLRLLWPQDRKQRGMALERLGARKTTLVFSPCTSSTSTYIGLVHCQLFASTVLPARIGRGRNDEMLESQNLRSENGSRNPNVYTNPPNWDLNTAARRVSVFTGAERGRGKGGWAVKMASATGTAGQKTHFLYSVQPNYNQ